MIRRNRRYDPLRVYDLVAAKNLAVFRMTAMQSIREYPDKEDIYLAQIDLVRLFSESVRRDLESLEGGSE